MKTLSAPARDNAIFIPLESVQSTGQGASCSMSADGPMCCEDENGPATVAMMITRRCNMSCAHCSVESSPRVKGEPTREELLTWVEGAAESGAKSVLITGAKRCCAPNWWWR